MLYGMAQDQCGKGKLSEAASPQGTLIEKEQSSYWNWNAAFYHQPQADNYLSL